MARRTNSFKVGTRVEAIGVSKLAPEYDVGTVVDDRPGSFLVRWDLANEIYAEDPTTLQEVE